MDDVHGAHGTAGVVEDPVLLEVDVRRVALAQLVDDVPDDAARVVAVGRDGARRQVVQVRRVEDVEAVEVLLDHPDDRGQERRQQGEDAQEGGDAARGRGL